ncbi:hypothetical protein [Bradyrhizobium valentinum]|uniref:Uncharacterized protein n=1 Tax=Bradyrhizobium valentinum TaxID=1518501 RepID=A0A0R3KKQ5_9BRAD|nr:hypothetical protein [Bradyrhizobium valentinum]KRQ96295.1 hypothetical protein CP49_37070 [Bradyrhizobium valentinum]
MFEAKTQSALFAREERSEHAGITGLRYLRRGDPDRPLLVFLPGGSHLARIAYGDPVSRRADFLDYWLERQGMGLLGLSYPSDHPAIDAGLSDLTIAAWADWIGSVTSAVLRETPRRQVAVAMWSMAGRSVAAVNAALLRRGVDAICFLSLAAVPPLPGLVPVDSGGEPLTSQGLWARTAAAAPGGMCDRRIQWFLAGLADQGRDNGRPILEEGVYLQHYLCNTPIMLRGTAQRYSASGPGWDLEDAQGDMSATRFAEFPLTAVIVPTDRADEKHALSDRTAWHFFNTQRIRSEAGPLDLRGEQWTNLRTLVGTLPSRLHREIRGGHFFFVGARGAEATVAHVASLIDEARGLRTELEMILGTRHAPTSPI